MTRCEYDGLTDGIASLLAQAQAYADLHHGGHLTIFKFTSGWKVAYDTPEMTGSGEAAWDGYLQVESLTNYGRLDDALAALLAERVAFRDMDVDALRARFKAEQMEIHRGGE